MADDASNIDVLNSTAQTQLKTIAADKQAEVKFENVKVPKANILAGGAATLTIAHLDAKGTLARTGGRATAKGARNAVVSADGTAYIADGPEGKILVVKPAKTN